MSKAVAGDDQSKIHPRGMNEWSRKRMHEKQAEGILDAGDRRRATESGGQKSREPTSKQLM
jgi:hypothetical protein